jgi:hypothetical protein
MKLQIAGLCDDLKKRGCLVNHARQLTGLLAHGDLFCGVTIEAEDSKQFGLGDENATVKTLQHE